MTIEKIDSLINYKLSGKSLEEIKNFLLKGREIASDLQEKPEYNNTFNPENLTELTLNHFKAEEMEMAKTLDFKKAKIKAADVADSYIGKLYEHQHCLIDLIKLISFFVKITEKYKHIKLGFLHIEVIKKIELCLYLHIKWIDEEIKKIEAEVMNSVIIDKNNISCMTYSIPESAKILGCSESILYRLCSNGSLEHRLVGKSIKLDYSTLINYGKKRGKYEKQ